MPSLQAKTKPHRVKCRAGYVRRVVSTPKRKHGRVVRVHGKIVYTRTAHCVKVKPKPQHKPTPPPTKPVTPPPVPPPPTTPTLPPPPPVPPANTTLPQVSGSTRQGDSLTAAPGAWTGTPSPSLVYQWQRCDAGGGSCQNVPGASASAYALLGVDVGSRLRVAVSATNTAGSVSALSAVTDVIGLASDPTAVAVGDIACPAGDTTNSCQQAATARLAASQNPSNVLMLGDAQYNSGLSTEYGSAGGYNDTWGVFNSTVRPVPGNHDYTASSTAAGYMNYFHNPPDHYSFNVGTWHVIALNSNCSNSSCADQLPGFTTSAQTSWLQSDLANSRSECVLAYWHHPRFASGFVGDSPGVGPLWTALYGAHADLVLGGHDHLYERYAQQDPSGAAAADGIREFVVGTGGENLSPVTQAEANLEVSDAKDFGVLVLTLRATSYDWAFKSTNGATIDSGTTACHGPGTVSAGAARDISASRTGHRTQPRLVFDARPRHVSLTAAVRRGLPVAMHCSRACDVAVSAWRRRGGHLQRIATFRETESQITRPYSQILLRLSASQLNGLSQVRLVLRFAALDAADHHPVVTRTLTLKR